MVIVTDDVKDLSISYWRTKIKKINEEIAETEIFINEMRECYGTAFDMSDELSYLAKLKRDKSELITAAADHFKIKKALQSNRSPILLPNGPLSVARIPATQPKKEKVLIKAVVE